MTPETLRTYANIFQHKRRYNVGGPLYPPREPEVAAAIALRFLANYLEAGNELPAGLDKVTHD